MNSEQSLDENRDYEFYINENVRLEEVCDFMMRGKHPDYVDYSDTKVLNQKALRWGEIKEEHLKYHNPDTEMFENRFLKKGDIAINSTGVGTLGRVYLFREDPGKIFADSHITILRTDEDLITPEYLYYVLRSPNYQNKIQNIAVGSTGQIELNKRELTELEISFPPKNLQEQIVNCLSPIDEKIDVNKRINENLEEIAQTVFKSWFVDFERYDEFKQSDIGKIPTGFEVSTFGEVSENYDSDRDPVSKTERNEIEGDIPYYGATKALDFMDDYLFDGKFLLIAEDGSVKTDEGYPVIQFINKKFWASNHVHVVQGKGKVSTEFLRWAMSFVKIKPYITGSVQPKLNQTNLNSIELAVPPEEDLEEFTDLVKPLHDRIWQNKRENDYLERLRDTLLPKLMSGEIRVDDIKLDELEVDR